MKATMTDKEMAKLLDPDVRLYNLLWVEEREEWALAEPNLRYCRRDAPVYEWRWSTPDGKWHGIGTEGLWYHVSGNLEASDAH